MTQRTFFVKALSLFAVVAAVILISSGFANAQFEVTGKVISVNDSSKTITIQPSMREPELGSGPVTFALTFPDRTSYNNVKTADIRGMRNESLRLSDIKAGDWVTVNYHQTPNAIYAADGILVGVPASTLPQAGVSGTTPGYAQNLTLTGKVVAIDKNAKTFTVDSSYATVPAEHKMLYTFALDRNGLVMAGDQRRDFSDLNIGDMITVYYHQETAGRILADRIAISPVVGPQASMLYPENRTAMSGAMVGRCVCPPNVSANAPANLPYGNVAASGVTPFSLTGRVVAIDKSDRTLTVDPSYFTDSSAYNKAAAGITSFKLDNGSAIMMGDRTMNFDDIHVGETVTVNYHQQSNGDIIADGIAINPALAPLPEERG